MAHCEKFTRAAAGHVCGHYDRSGVAGREDPNIDPTLTHLNYNLAADLQPMPQMEFIRKRCQELKALNRNDVNVLCDWIVTAPKDLPVEDEELFFREAFRFLSKRYGDENVVSAYVHRDEPGAKPHLHFAFVPVAYDVAKDRYRVNAKKCISRTELKRFHPELSAHLERVFGRDVGVILSDDEVLEEQQRKYKPMPELKRETAIRIKLEQENRILEGFIQDAKAEITALQSELGKTKAELNDVKEQLTAAQIDLGFEQRLLDGKLARQRKAEAELEALRAELSEASESLQTTLTSRNEYNAEINRLRGPQSPLAAVYAAIRQFAMVVVNPASTRQQIVQAANKILEPFPAIVKALANCLGFENRTNMPQEEREAPALVDDVNELISGATARADRESRGTGKSWELGK